MAEPRFELIQAFASLRPIRELPGLN